MTCRLKEGLKSQVASDRLRRLKSHDLSVPRPTFPSLAKGIELTFDYVDGVVDREERHPRAGEDQGHAQVPVRQCKLQRLAVAEYGL
jgi:hypothetical protein